jgi:hypothetical protein
MFLLPNSECYEVRGCCDLKWLKFHSNSVKIGQIVQKVGRECAQAHSTMIS